MNNGKFITLNIRDCLENKIEGLSVADLKEALSEFSSIDPNVGFCDLVDLVYSY